MFEVLILPGWSGAGSGHTAGEWPQTRFEHREKRHSKYFCGSLATLH